MKKLICLFFSVLIALPHFSQSRTFTFGHQCAKTDFNERSLKAEGYYFYMQGTLMMGSNQSVNRTSYNPASSFVLPGIVPEYGYARPAYELKVAPSVIVTNGYQLNSHWAAGVGVGIELMDYILVPLLGEIRYTVWANRISPVLIFKGGYSFGNLKPREYQTLYLDWSPNYFYDVTLRNYGGLFLNPEIGVSLPLSTNCDLILTAAYRFQKLKSVVHKENGPTQFDEWEHKREINLLSFGTAFLFR